MCREGRICPSDVQFGHRGYGAESSRPSSFAMLGRFAWGDGVPATPSAPSDVDDFLTDAGYFLMTLGHQSRYDLF